MLDIADPAQVARAMTGSAAALGDKLDVLVANAGITTLNTSVCDYPTEEWQRVIDVNLNGALYCNCVAIPALEQNGCDRIVNTASISSKDADPNTAAYSISKAEVIGLTKSLGKQSAKTDNRVNCVTPAAVRAAFTSDVATPYRLYVSNIPIRRFGGFEACRADPLACQRGGPRSAREYYSASPPVAPPTN